MEKLKKILMITSISAIGVASLMLILQVFGVPMFEGVQLRILLIVATLGASSGIAINEIGVIKRKRILGYVSLALLAVSVVLAIIIFSTNLLTTGEWFNKITGVIALVSVMFIFVVSLYSKSGSHLIGLQIPAYASVAGITIILVLTILGVNVLGQKGLIELFIILCIAAVALSIILSVINSKRKTTEGPRVDAKGDFVTIPKEEYEALKKENEELKAKLQELTK